MIELDIFKAGSDIGDAYLLNLDSGHVEDVQRVGYFATRMGESFAMALVRNWCTVAMRSGVSHLQLLFRRSRLLFSLMSL